MEYSINNLSLMKRSYDFIFISHLPSFYKINLFNRVSRSISVLVIFLGETSAERTIDFVKGEKEFDYCFLNSGHFENRLRWRSSWGLFRLLRNIKYKRLAVGAWDLPESWIAILCSKKSKNIITQESSIFESELRGWKRWLKYLFSRRLSLALVSGEPHARLMRSVGFDGQILVTGGVGLANRSDVAGQFVKKFTGRFLYVGRLAPEKNLTYLLRVFALPEMGRFHLTLAGTGPDYELLSSSATDNVSFIGHISNESLPEIYASHDVLILPSLSEPWGLVVEEALYYGLPVLASSKVGSVEDLVLSYGAGLSFSAESESSLRDAINTMAIQYEQYVNAVRAINFNSRDTRQVQVYVDAVSEGEPC